MLGIILLHIRHIDVVQFSIHWLMGEVVSLGVGGILWCLLIVKCQQLEGRTCSISPSHHVGEAALWCQCPAALGGTGLPSGTRAQSSSSFLPPPPLGLRGASQTRAGLLQSLLISIATGATAQHPTWQTKVETFQVWIQNRDIPQKHYGDCRSKYILFSSK